MPQPYVHIELDKPRKLRFRHNDLADLEVASGKGLGDLMTGMSMHGMRLLLCYGLRWQDKGNEQMTPQKAGTLIDLWMEKGGTLETLAAKLTDTLMAGGFLQDATTQPDEGEAASVPEGNADPEAAT